MKHLLLVVDYQFDFASPQGTLSAGPAALEIEHFLDARIRQQLDAGQQVIFTLDTHLPDTWAQHPEHAAFPLHCQKDTPGWQVYGAPARHLAHPQVRVLEKAAYCPPFADIEEWVWDFDGIDIMGLVTDICVLHTAVGLYTAKVNNNRPIQLRVLDQGCGSFNQEGHRFALQHMHGVLGM